jgi:LytR cell envelope-related transcriptional attenuator
VLIVGGVLVGVAVLAFILTSAGGGGSSGTSATASSPSTSSHVSTTHSKPHAKHVSTTSSSSAASPAETSVAVLNGTETAGLAHTTSERLRQNGYTQANALNGRPPGANQYTVVEYKPGHSAEAQGVAHSLNVTRVQPIESATAALAGSASVAVVVGLEQAANVP